MTVCTGGSAWDCLWGSGLDAAIMMTPCKGWTMTAWGGNALTCVTISDHSPLLATKNVNYVCFNSPYAVTTLFVQLRQLSMHDTHFLDRNKCRRHCVLTLLGLRQVSDGYCQGTGGAPSVGWGRLHAGWYEDMSSRWYVEMSSSLHTTHSSRLHTTQHAICPTRQMVILLYLDSIHPVLA